MDWGSIEHFEPWEFDSPDLEGSSDSMKLEFVTLLDKARKIAKVSFSINSGYRTASHNNEVGGVNNSAHLRGYAADIHAANNFKRSRILQALYAVGFDRIGIGKNFIHVDNDPSLPAPRTWLY